MGNNLRGVLIASIIYPLLWIAVGLILQYVREPTTGMKLLAGLLLFAIFVDWIVLIANIVADAKKRGISVAFGLLGFFLTFLGGIIYYFIARTYGDSMKTD